MEDRAVEPLYGRYLVLTSYLIYMIYDCGRLCPCGEVERLRYLAVAGISIRHNRAVDGVASNSGNVTVCDPV